MVALLCEPTETSKLFKALLYQVLWRSESVKVGFVLRYLTPSEVQSALILPKRQPRSPENQRDRPALSTQHPALITPLFSPSRRSVHGSRIRATTMEFHRLARRGWP